MVAPMGGAVVFSSQTQWTAAPDGRVAIVTPDPYQVEMVGPEGTRRTATRVEYTPIRVTEAHKEAWRTESRRSSRSRRDPAAEEVLPAD